MSTGSRCKRRRSSRFTCRIGSSHRPDMSLVVRTAMDPSTIVSAVRGEIRKLDPELPIPEFRTLDQMVDASLAQRRFQLNLVPLFAAAALLLAGVAVYGVVSQS